MPQYRLEVHKDAINKAGLQNAINDLMSRDKSQQYLNFPQGNGGVIYVSDNVNSMNGNTNLFSNSNRNTINSGAGGLAQEGQEGYVFSIYIQSPSSVDKPFLHTLIHEIGHFRWKGIGANKIHDKLFYKLLDDTLKAFGLNPYPDIDLNIVDGTPEQNAQELIDLRNMPSPAGSQDPRTFILNKKKTQEDHYDHNSINNKFAIIQTNPAFALIQEKDQNGNLVGNHYYNFDSLGIKDESSYYSDGTHFYTFYNNRGTDSIQAVTHYYDTSDRVLYRDTINSNGLSDRFTVDTYNNQYWSSHELRYDDKGNTITHIINHDDNQKDINTFDPYNLNPWSWHGVHYDANGRQVSQTIFNDDGTKDLNFQDAYNQNYWSWYNLHQDASGATLSQTIFNDDGGRFYHVYDTANAFGWSWTAEHFRSNGSKAARYIFGDDGSHKVEYWKDSGRVDLVNTPDSIAFYNTAGELVRTQEINYGVIAGTSKQVIASLFTDDVGNKSFWSRISHYYNSLGVLVAINELFDNGGWHMVNNPPQDFYTSEWNYSNSVDSNQFITHNAAMYSGNGGVLSYFSQDRVGTWSVPIFNDSISSNQFAAYGVSYSMYDSYSPINNYSGSNYVGYKGYDFKNDLAGLSSFNINLKPPSETYFSDYMPSGFYFAWQPIAIDLDGNGVDIVLSGSSTAKFDIDGSGERLTTAWVDKNDGLLVIDLSADGSFGPDGIIDQAQEVRFTLWGDQSSPSNLTDLAALKLYFDSNADGLFDSSDLHWSDFRIWQDHNQDGISESGEIYTLKEKGIKTFNLQSDQLDFILSDGSVVKGLGDVHLENGKNILMADMAFATSDIPTREYNPFGYQTINRDISEKIKITSKYEIDESVYLNNYIENSQDYYIESSNYISKNGVLNIPFYGDEYPQGATGIV